MSESPVCRFCDENPRGSDPVAPRERVHLSNGWRVVVHKSGLEGWLLVVPRRHMLAISDLTIEEATELGLILREATRTLVEVLGAKKTYVMQFSEETPHLHFSVVPRMLDIPDDRKGFAVAQYNAGDPQPESARDAIALRLIATWSLGPSESGALTAWSAR